MYVCWNGPGKVKREESDAGVACTNCRVPSLHKAYLLSSELSNNPTIHNTHHHRSLRRLTANPTLTNMVITNLGNKLLPGYKFS